MKPQKSRTLIGRTLARVKSRLTSFGSGEGTQSPNPLIAPPASPSRTRRAFRTVPQRSPAHDTIRAPKTQRTVIANNSSTRTITNIRNGQTQSKREGVHILDLDVDEARIAALRVDTSTWTVFGTTAKYAATAYVNIEVSSTANAAAEDGNASAGHLYGLKISHIVTGPGVIIKQYGDVTRRVLVPGEEQWTSVLHIGIKDTSLAAKLSTSFRSIGGRLKKVSNMEVINRWLNVLQEDTAPRSTTMHSDPVEVRIKITFKHTLMPRTTTLYEERLVTVAMTEGEVERAKAVLNDDEDEDEERLREMRVLGAPWL